MTTLELYDPRHKKFINEVLMMEQEPIDGISCCIYNADDYSVLVHIEWANVSILITYPEHYPFKPIYMSLHDSDEQNKTYEEKIAMIYSNLISDWSPVFTLKQLLLTISLELQEGN